MRIFICPLAHAEECSTALQPQKVLGLLSPGQNEAALNVPRVGRLELRFNDIVAPQLNLVPPGKEDVRAILDFARDADSLLIYCFAGVSRSTAAAYSIACQTYSGHDEIDIARRLRQLLPWATPNPLMVALADEILGRAGRMSAAIAQIGRGDGLFAGQSIALTVETISG